MIDLQKLIFKRPKCSYKKGDFITLNIPLQVRGLNNRPYFSYNMKTRFPKNETEPIQTDNFMKEVLDSAFSCTAKPSQCKEYSTSYMSQSKGLKPNKANKGFRLRKELEEWVNERKKHYSNNYQFYSQLKVPNPTEQFNSAFLNSSKYPISAPTESNLFYADSHPYIAALFNSKKNTIFCLYKPCIKPSPYLMIYFHSRDEDAGGAMKFADQIASSLFVNLLVVEYPGYGLRAGNTKCDPQRVIVEATKLIYFLTENVGINPESLLIGGRSIGCAPAIHIANRFGANLGGVFVISPFTTLRNVARDWLSGGIGKFLSGNLDVFLFGKKNKIKLKEMADEIRREENEDEVKSGLRKEMTFGYDRSFSLGSTSRRSRGRSKPQNLNLFDLQSLMERVNAPILIIHGENDTIFDKKNSEVRYLLTARNCSIAVRVAKSIWKYCPSQPIPNSTSQMT